MTPLLRPAAALCAAALTAGCAAELDDRSFEGLALDPALAEAPRLGAAVQVRSDPDDCIAVTRQVGDRFRIAGVETLTPVLAATAVDFALGLVQRRLEAREAGLSGAVVGRGVPKEPLSEGTHCVVIYHGLLGPAWREGAVPGGRLAGKTDWLRTLGLVDMPAFYMEAALDVEIERGAEADVATLTLRPAYLAYVESAARERGSGRKNVSIALALHGAAPANADAPEEGALGVFRVDLGRLPIGAEIHDPAGEGALSGTASRLVLSPPPDRPNLAALVVETETPGAAFSALREAFEGNRADLDAALTEILSEALGGTED